MGPWLALLLVLPARAADAPAEQTMGSVHALIQRSMREALEWSPDARLYSIVGRAPKAGVLLEEWTLAYGDPKAREGFYAVKFGDGVIQERHVARGGRVVREYYWEGKLRNRMEANANGVYANNAPLGAEFMDAGRLDSLLKARGFKNPPGGQFTLELYRVLDIREGFDGTLTKGAFDASGTPTKLVRTAFLVDGVYRQNGPEPPNGYDRALWTVDNLDQTVYLDAATGKLVNRRPTPSKAPADYWEIR